MTNNECFWKKERKRRERKFDYIFYEVNEAESIFFLRNGLLNGVLRFIRALRHSLHIYKRETEHTGETSVHLFKHSLGSVIILHVKIH
jgi:hypothetical protein